MSEGSLDIELDRAQIDAISETLGRLMQSVRKRDPQYKTTQSAIIHHWQMYLTNVLIEATHIARGQATRTARKRHQALKQVEAFLGHYPNDADAQIALSKGGQWDKSLLKVINEDVSRLKVQPPPKHRRSGIEVLEDRIAKLKRKGDTNRGRKKSRESRSSYE